MIKINKDTLSKDDRKKLISEIESMKFLDELFYTYEGRHDYSTIIKVESGFLFKHKYSENFIFLNDINFI